MKKSFWDVFPSLILDEEIKKAFDEVFVERVAATRRQNYLTVYVNSKYLIDKRIIYKVEHKISKHLIRLSGLSHGTDVWVGNAKDLIEEGIATLSSCICCRDDIMVYLIQKGMDKSLSFKTMESVRKGKGLSEEMETAMREVDVPEWYIDSCKKIKYMFPKAHAAAYVMMAWRIGYFKVYIPQAFYVAWFSIRAKSLSYERMFQGLSNLRHYMQEYRNKLKDNTFTPVEKDELAAMRVAEEMYERGIEVVPIDIYKADAKSFKVYGNKIMPSLVSLDRLGENVARQIVEAAKNGEFTSRDDFKNRTKCPRKEMS